jgi:DnaJ-class molecular chaperone
MTIDDASGDVPRCKEHGLDKDWTECEQCGGEGCTQPGELYEMDPLWYDEDDTEPCHLCNGRGGWWSCWECCAQAEREERLKTAARTTEKGTTDDR